MSNRFDDKRCAIGAFVDSITSIYGIITVGFNNIMMTLELIDVENMK
jgi:hypothetical protein